MAEQTRLEIVSPTRLLLSEMVDLAEIPATEGYIGVLAGHAPMIVTLRGGVIRVHQGGSVTRELYVGGGFAEIAPDRCTVLADEAKVGVLVASVFATCVALPLLRAGRSTPAERR